MWADPRAQARSEIAPVPSLLRELSHKAMLPAIVFIFSRAGCDAAAEQAAALRTPLVGGDEVGRIESIVADFKRANGALLASLDALTASDSLRCLHG